MIARSKFEALLAERMGLDPESIGAASVQRAVQQRADQVTAGNVEQYWNVLTTSIDERQALIELVVVPETWFFRYPESLHLFADRVQRMLHARQASGSRAPVRVISLPCSTGEEPYSIVMALRARGITSDQVVVHALDISTVAIERARQGVYGKNAFRTENLDFRAQHFSNTPQGYVLAPSIRAAVDFRVENIFDLSADTRALPYDVVFCRNLLIYFDPETQRRALDVLAQLSGDTTEMFVGPAEASLLTRAGYVSVGTHRAFAFSRARRGESVPIRPRQPGLDSLLAPKPKMAGRRLDGLPPQRYESPSHRYESASRPDESPPQRYESASRPDESPSVRYGSPTLRREGVTKRSIARTAQPPARAPHAQNGFVWIHALADQGRVDEAMEAARQALLAQGPDAGLFYLLGLCLDARNELTQAAAHYRKALYLEPDHVPALNHLAVLLDGQGDRAGAARMRQRAMRKEARNG